MCSGKLSIGLNSAHTRVACIGKLTELEKHSPNPVPCRGIFRIILQDVSIRIESELKVSLAEKPECEIESRTQQAAIVAHCPPEPICRFLRFPCIPEQGAEVVVGRSVPRID